MPPRGTAARRADIASQPILRDRRLAKGLRRDRLIKNPYSKGRDGDPVVDQGILRAEPADLAKLDLKQSVFLGIVTFVALLVS